MHAAPITETDFGLGRMHIDVDTFRWQFKEQHIGRMAFVVQHIAIRLANGVVEQFVAHKAAVDEQVLRIASGTRIRRQTGQAEQSQRAGSFIQGTGRLGKVLAQHFQRPRLPVGHCITPRHAAVVRQREGAARMRQRQTAQGFVAMAVFGGGGFQEFTSRRRIEEQVARLDHRATTQCRRFSLAQQAVERDDLPGVLMCRGAVTEPADQANRATEAILASASPRKPRLATRSSSSRLKILLVACRVSASGRSSGAMPLPLSATRISLMPPSFDRRGCRSHRHPGCFPVLPSMPRPDVRPPRQQRFARPAGRGGDEWT